MKSFFRLVLLLGIAMLATSGLVSAQTTPAAFCGDLNAADCSLIQDSQAAMTDLESSSFTLDMNMDISGIPEMPNGLAFSLTGSGLTTTDKSLLAGFSDLDPTKFATDPAAIFDVITDALPAIGADLQFSLTLPQELLKEMGGALPETLKLSLKMVDGVLYVNAEELATYIPQMKGAAGWLGIDLAEAVSLVMKQPGFAESLKEMQGMNTGSMNPELMQAFSDPEAIASFMSIERVGDSQVDGKDVAVFEMTLDYAGLMKMPAMQDMMKQQFEASGTKMSDAEMEQMLAMMQTIGENITLTVHQQIDPETKYLLQTSMNMSMDMSAIMAAAGGSSGAAPKMNFDMTIGQGDFNSVEEITVPDGAFMLPLNGMSQST